MSASFMVIGHSSNVGCDLPRQISKFFESFARRLEDEASTETDDTLGRKYSAEIIEQYGAEGWVKLAKSMRKH